ncbi:alpha/beta hydrolase [Halobacillus litoralis]|uniref:alpha/beta hydrolase n=1 Tax=Halobacillus litoralis TaxID=45668 RepID=UPI001CD5D41A|nr:alpha/beta hydrolase [Halobacillus litoralis]MCA0970562.1 alpha/beta hydrolase [Halobacillus litoralis]
MGSISNQACEYFVEKVGSGEPVIFLPAGGFSGNEGLNIAEHLEGRFETHLIDLPGLGKSRGIEGKVTSELLADWLKSYIDQMDIEKVNVIGHSLGGAVSLAFAVHYPQRVKNLILLDQGHKPFPRVPTSEFGPFAFALPFLNIGYKLFGERFLNRLEPLFTKDTAQEVSQDRFEEDMKRFCEHVHTEANPYVRTALKHPADFSDRGLNLMFGYYNLNLPELLKKVTVPTYLYYGTFKDIDEKEHRKTKEYIEKLEGFNLPIRYVSVPGGHYVHWNKDFSLGGLEQFLKKEAS